MPRSRNWPIGFAQTDHVRTGKEGEGRVVPGAPRIRRSPLARPTVALARLERTNRSATSGGRKAIWPVLTLEIGSDVMILVPNDVPAERVVALVRAVRGTA